MTLASAMLYPLIRAERKPAAARSKSDIFLFLIPALRGVFPGQVLVNRGTRLSTAYNAAIIMLAIPPCTAFFAFLRERIRPSGSVAILLDPDVAQVFRSSESVNAVLRALVATMSGRRRGHTGPR